MDTNFNESYISNINVDSSKAAIVFDRQHSRIDIFNKRLYPIASRVRDVVCSLIALIVLAPVMLIVSLLIYIDDPKGSPKEIQIIQV